MNACALLLQAEMVLSAMANNYQKHLQARWALQTTDPRFALTVTLTAPAERRLAVLEREVHELPRVVWQEACQAVCIAGML